MEKSIQIQTQIFIYCHKAVIWTYRNIASLVTIDTDISLARVTYRITNGAGGIFSQNMGDILHPRGVRWKIWIRDNHMAKPYRRYYR